MRGVVQGLDTDCWMTAFAQHERTIGEEAMTGRFGSEAAVASIRSQRPLRPSTGHSPLPR